MREAGFWETYLTLCSVPVASALETSAARSRLSKELLAELAARRPPAIQLSSPLSIFPQSLEDVGVLENVEIDQICH